MESQDKCPVDHTAREKWLSSASLNGGEGDTPAACPVDHSKLTSVAKSTKIPEECSSDRIDQTATSGVGEYGLSREREISSIPRAGTGGNWVYPSQEQFFNAMKRKNLDPNSRDMKVVIPIHNAVNERAWYEILKWEDGKGGSKCGGPTLVRFQGDATKLTPRARWNMMWGMQKPFDRHDWVVDRCGTQVEYVIDFYTGKANPLMPDMPSFYLDVRPKLNSFEGVRMRVAKFFGF